MTKKGYLEATERLVHHGLKFRIVRAPGGEYLMYGTTRGSEWLHHWPAEVANRICEPPFKVDAPDEEKHGRVRNSLKKRKARKGEAKDERQPTKASVEAKRDDALEVTISIAEPKSRG